MLESPPRSPRRRDAGVVIQIEQRAECESYTTESKVANMDFQPHLTNRRPPQPQSIQPSRKVSEFQSRPAGRIDHIQGSKPQAVSEGRRLSKSSVYNNIHRPRHRRAVEPFVLATIQSQLDEDVSHKLPPTAERTAAWDLDMMKPASSHYSHIAAH